MRKKYLPIILEKAEIIEELLEDFFIEYKIVDREYAREVICDELVKSFIEGTLDDLEYFFETKSERIINKIFTHNIMEKFVADGIISVNPNGNFDLTEKGEGIVQKLQEKFKIKD